MMNFKPFGKYLHYSLSCLMMLLVVGTQAQTVQRCGMDHVMEELRNQNPQLFDQNVAASDAAYQRYLSDVENGTIEKRANCEVYMIPVVIHVIHDNGASNISLAKAESQIDALNDHFRRLPGTHGYGDGVDTRLQFALAQRDPSGAATNGILYHNNPALADHTSGFSGGGEYGTLGSTYFWPGCLNFWVVKSINGSSNILGYTYTPEQGISNRGIVLIYTAFGTIQPLVNQYEMGISGVHEAGHWFGLYHTFGNGISQDPVCQGTDASNCLSLGDRVCDTPQEIDPPFTCGGPVNSCEDTPCDWPDPKNNYLDYRPDNCLNQFTAGQTERMEFFLNGNLAPIYSTPNLTTYGIDMVPAMSSEPVADFSFSTVSGCAGSLISFSNESFGCVENIMWVFQGGTPMTSTEENPFVTFNQPGSFTVNLTVSNTDYTQSVTKTAIIDVPDAALADTIPYVESFESGSFPPAGWRVYDEDGAGTWERKTLVSTEGIASASFPAFTSASCGQSEDLIMPLMDLNNVYEAYLRFSYAYKAANNTTADADRLRVQVSNTCGLTYPFTILDRAGQDLSTSPGFNSSTAFEPLNITEWTTETLNLTPYVGQNVRIRFRFEGKQGQNFYLDNVEVIGLKNSIQEDLALASATVQPNPFSHGFTLNVNIPHSRQLRAEIVDLQGRKIHIQDLGHVSPGKHEFELNDARIQNLPSGVYMLHLISQNGISTKKIVKM